MTDAGAMEPYWSSSHLSTDAVHRDEDEAEAEALEEASGDMAGRPRAREEPLEEPSLEEKSEVRVLLLGILQKRRPAIMPRREAYSGSGRQQGEASWESTAELDPGLQTVVAPELAVDCSRQLGDSTKVSSHLGCWVNAISGTRETQGAARRG
ncbi:hypothetical protein M406DRAFT_327557 [Cryphonectria parasitica EP155]|uniref:Uncharacterized protein n=1 Tax=Cryphonectria parasitica (strain ATCC 38755 / EP155) TaxID=660469 RepID=A0A9P4YA08_CRYP1|nr:uncharacterized protein M406DRAFT_327557 [Cryphonectria parasitica EP155]KAF3769154.1 hypothetical protein M406DRAFT_327557 [Cryphonectria parasitica EP155]